MKPNTAKANATCSNGKENERPLNNCSLEIAYEVDCIETAITRVTTEKKKTIPSRDLSNVLYVPINKISQVIKQAETTHNSMLKTGIIRCPASATAPARPPMPAIEGTTPINMNQTSQEAFFPFKFVFGPGISEKDSKKVLLATIT